jgi:hypothetical protein
MKIVKIPTNMPILPKAARGLAKQKGFPKVASSQTTRFNTVSGEQFYAEFAMQVQAAFRNPFLRLVVAFRKPFQCQRLRGTHYPLPW